MVVQLVFFFFLPLLSVANAATSTGLIRRTTVSDSLYSSDGHAYTDAGNRRVHGRTSGAATPCYGFSSKAPTASVLDRNVKFIWSKRRRREIRYRYVCFCDCLVLGFAIRLKVTFSFSLLLYSYSCIYNGNS